MTPEITLLNDLKTPQKWGLALPMPLTTVNISFANDVVVLVVQCDKPARRNVHGVLHTLR